MTSLPCINDHIFRYGLIASVSASAQESANVLKEKCVKVLNTCKFEPPEFQIGITKVLLM